MAVQPNASPRGDSPTPFVSSDGAPLQTQKHQLSTKAKTLSVRPDQAPPTNTRPFVPLRDGKKDYASVRAAADLISRSEAFVAHCFGAGGEIVSAFLPTTASRPDRTFHDFDPDDIDLARFKGMWERFKKRFLRAYPGVEGILVIERDLTKEEVGEPHGHVLLRFPPHYAKEVIYGPAEQAWRAQWGAVFIATTGRTLTKSAKFFPPDDGVGCDIAKYAAKFLNRSNRPAKFGRLRNESFLLTMNLRGGAVWDRDSLPSRTMGDDSVAAWVHSKTGLRDGSWLYREREAA